MVCVCVCVFVSAHVRTCVRVCVCLRACDVLFVCVSMCGTSLYRPKERPELSVAFKFDPSSLNILLQCFVHLYMTTLGQKKLVRKEFAT